MTTLLLRAPTTRPRDVAISLRAPAGCPVTAAAIETVAIRCSCPPAVAARVRSCILHSGRYDCRVSAAAALWLASGPPALATIGGSAILTEMG